MKLGKFIEPTLWAIWWLVVGGAAFWVIVGSIGFFSRNGWLPNEAAGWAQAVGAGVAVVTAAFIPMWHAKVATRERQKNLLGVMRVLADQALEKIWLLSNSFIHLEIASKMMREYLVHHRDEDWPGPLDAINKIPIADLPPDKAIVFGQLHDAVLFAKKITGELQKWAERGHAQPDMLVALRAKRDLLSLARSRLPPVAGVSVVGKVDAQIRGEPLELKRPFAEPFVISGVKVFRYFMWDDDETTIPSGAIVQCLFPYQDFECDPEYFPNNGWESLSDADDQIIQNASNKIGSNTDWVNYLVSRG
jgi:hypothetical protein